MAYATTNPPALISQRVGAAGGAIWIYKDGDNITTVTAADYITNGDALGLVAGDVVFHIDTDTNIATRLQVSSVTAGGAATLAGGSLELTATAAVPVGTTSLELNHATVVIAATIADAAKHAGLFVVVNTSASGTAAHTLTLTSGTFNGTNNVATLNAPKEALAVWFDSAGNGTVLENVGTVGLS
jgi:hypothetical protein